MYKVTMWCDTRHSRHRFHSIFCCWLLASSVAGAGFVVAAVALNYFCTTFTINFLKREHEYFSRRLGHDCMKTHTMYGCVLCACAWYEGKYLAIIGQQLCTILRCNLFSCVHMRIAMKWLMLSFSRSNGRFRNSTDGCFIFHMKSAIIFILRRREEFSRSQQLLPFVEGSIQQLSNFNGKISMLPTREEELKQTSRILTNAWSTICS